MSRFKFAIVCVVRHERLHLIVPRKVRVTGKQHRKTRIHIEEKEIKTGIGLMGGHTAAGALTSPGATGLVREAL